MYSVSGLGGLGAPRARAMVAVPAVYSPSIPRVSAAPVIPSPVAPVVVSPSPVTAFSPPRVSPGMVSSAMVAPSLVPMLTSTTPSPAVQAIIPITAWLDRFRRPRQWSADSYQSGGPQVQMQDDGSGASQASTTDTSASTSAPATMQAAIAETDWGMALKVMAGVAVVGGAFYVYKRRKK